MSGPPWLDELTAKYGAPRLAYPDPVDLGDCERRCWAWFPVGQNHNLAVDKNRFDVHPWTVAASTPGRCVRLTMSLEPDDATIRAVAVAAGLLP